MTDRELLELAAKAAEIQLHWPQDIGGAEHLPPQNTVDWKEWRPLADDGDALRLAMKLDMSVEISAYEASTYAYAGGVPRVYAMELWRENKNAATRRAIVRAAAEMGKAMP